VLRQSIAIPRQLVVNSVLLLTCVWFVIVLPPCLIYKATLIRAGACTACQYVHVCRRYCWIAWHCMPPDIWLARPIILTCISIIPLGSISLAPARHKRLPNEDLMHNQSHHARTIHPGTNMAAWSTAGYEFGHAWSPRPTRHRRALVHTGYGLARGCKVGGQWMPPPSVRFGVLLLRGVPLLVQRDATTCQCACLADSHV
jgi:hypothetical protein